MEKKRRERSTSYNKNKKAKPIPLGLEESVIARMRGSNAEDAERKAQKHFGYPNWILANKGAKKREELGK